MKQIIIYICLVICAITAVIVIRLNEKPIAEKVITVSQYYSVMDAFQGMDVPIYITNDEHLLTHEDAYQSLYLMNEDESKKLEVTLECISIDGEEVYLSETYTRYVLELDLPVLNDDFYMENCYIDITLLNGLSYQFELGYFSYLDVEDNADYMFWTGLESIKAVGVDIARIKEIAISFDTLTEDIDHISIGSDVDTDFTISNGLVTLSIADEDLLLYGCPIRITYMDHTTQLISYFNYLKENAILHSSGLLNHVYDVSIVS